MNGFNSVGIDIQSLIIYTVNFGVLYLIVSKFLVGPILKILQKRTELIEKNLQEAEKIKIEMVKDKKDFIEKQQEMRTKMDTEIKDFEKNLNESFRKSQKEIEDKKESMMLQAKNEIEKAKKDIFNQVKTELIDTIQKVTLKAKSIENKDLKENIKEAIDGNKL